MKNNQLMIELAARSKLISGPDEFRDPMNDQLYMRFIFDTSNVYGDHSVINVLAPFATEDTARMKLYENLIQSFS